MRKERCGYVFFIAFCETQFSSSLEIRYLPNSRDYRTKHLGDGNRHSSSKMREYRPTSRTLIITGALFMKAFENFSYTHSFEWSGAWFSTRATEFRIQNSPICACFLRFGILEAVACEQYHANYIACTSEFRMRSEPNLVQCEYLRGRKEKHIAITTNV